MPLLGNIPKFHVRSLYLPDNAVLTKILLYTKVKTATSRQSYYSTGPRVQERPIQRPSRQNRAPLHGQALPQARPSMSSRAPRGAHEAAAAAANCEVVEVVELRARHAEHIQPKAATGAKPTRETFMEPLLGSAITQAPCSSNHTLRSRLAF